MEHRHSSGSHRCPFLNRSNIKRSYSTMAESHRSRSPSTLFVSQDEPPYPQEQEAALDQHTGSFHSRNRSTRYPGDGLDHRRPIMSQSTSNTGSATDVIDLTGDLPDIFRAPPTSSRASPRTQRLPRYDRDIIDVPRVGSSRSRMAHSDRRSNTPQTRASREPQSHPQFPGLRQQTAIPVDDEIEITGENIRSRPHTISADRNQPIDLTGDNDDDDDEDFEITGAAQGGVNMVRPGTTAGVGTHSTNTNMDDLRLPIPQSDLPPRLQQRLHGVNARLTNSGFDFLNVQHLLEVVRNNLPVIHADAAPRHRTHARHHHTHSSHSRHHPSLPRNHHLNHLPHVHLHEGHIGNLRAFAVVPDMNYETPAFEVGHRGRSGSEPSKYVPPEEPGPGFTRSPGEDEVVVCPSCGDELAVGETDLKREIWVLKGCGHAYCGECTHSKAKGSTKASKKGKGRAADSSGPLTLKDCVVDGCGMKVGRNSMVHVFF